MVARFLLAAAVIATLLGAGSMNDAVVAPARVDGGVPKMLSPAEIAQASATIDRLIDANLARNGLKPNAEVSDHVFLRRAWLEIAGRIPTHDEAAAFLADRKADKRAALIARLIASDAYASRMFCWWADLLRVTTRLQDRYPGAPYIDWLKTAVRENRPYDAMVRELITADGAALAPGNGATGFYVRDAGMPLDHMANTVQLFLGTRLACAQCHDHPFDVWKQRDFFAMCAYTNGTKVERNPAPAKGLSKQDRQELKKEREAAPQEVRNILRQLGYTVALRVDGKGTQNMPLPRDYQYEDAKPGQAIPAHTIFGAATPVTRGVDPRAAYAKWMTAPDNPRFTVVIANRVWRKVFGVGLIEPVDNLMDATVAANPELMTFLTRLMASVQYDLKRFQHILYQTKAWQRSTTVGELDPAEPYHVQGPFPRRLAAEQLWDSLITLAVAKPDVPAPSTQLDALHRLYDEYKDASSADLMVVARQLADARERGQQLQQQAQRLQSRIAGAKPAERAKLREEFKAITAQRDALSESVPVAQALQNLKGEGKRRGQLQLLRASELPSPAPQGHLLRTFGQSDRMLIDNASSEATATQALELMNGFVDQHLGDAQSAMQRLLAQAPDTDAKVRALFFAVLARPPTADELAMGRATVAADAGGALDLAWALINSHEFRFLP